MAASIVAQGAWQPRNAQGAWWPGGGYPATGTVVALNNTVAGTLTDIAWVATETGDNEGDIYKIEVWTEGGWTQVGGDSPTSPITSLSLAVTTGTMLRITLTPGAAGLETPILTSITATITEGAAASAAYYYASLVRNRQGRY